jgi:hypothetical protein
MKLIMSRGVLLLALAAVATGGWQAPLQAQSSDRSATLARGSWEPWQRLMNRQPAVDDALRSHGYRGDRLDRAQERALDDTFVELFPGLNPQWDRLNRTQATALVYMALVHNTGRDPHRGTPRQAFCGTTARRVADLDLLYDPPARGRPQWLRTDEQRRLRAETEEIARLARGCGEVELLDHANAFIAYLSERRTDRERTSRYITRMKTLARVAVY